MKSYESYLPAFLQPYREIQVIAAAENKVVSSLWETFAEVSQNQWIQTATQEGLQRWETMMGLLPGTFTLEERRERVLANWNAATSYTEKMFREWVDRIFVHHPYQLEINGERYEVHLTCHYQFYGKAEMVREAGRRILPANLELWIQYEYNVQASLKDWTHGQLSQKTHEAIRKEDQTVWQLTQQTMI